MVLGLSSKYKYVVLAFIVSLILLIIVPPAIDFSSANPFWNGYAKFTVKINARVMLIPLDKATFDPDHEV